MKILHIITGLGQGGAERLLLSVCREHQRLGNEQKVVYLINRTDFLEKFKAEGFEVSRVVASKGIVGLLGCINKLKKFIRDYNPDVVHTHLPRADFLARIAGIMLPRCKVITTIHNSDEWKSRKTFPSFCLRTFNRLTVNLFKRFHLVAVSESVRRYCMKTEKISAKKITTLQNFTDPPPPLSDDPITRQKLGIPDDTFLFLNIGRLAHQKNQLEVVRAAAKFKDRNSYFLIVGEGENRAELEELIAKEQLTNIQLPGFVSNVHELYLIADIMLMTSRYEGQPIAVHEAIRNKLPVLSSDIEPIKDMIEIGFSVLTYKEGNVESLYEMIDAVMTGKLDYRSTIEDSYKKSLAHTAERYVYDLIELYNSV